MPTLSFVWKWMLQLLCINTQYTIFLFFSFGTNKELLLSKLTQFTLVNKIILSMHVCLLWSHLSEAPNGKRGKLIVFYCGADRMFINGHGFEMSILLNGGLGSPSDPFVLKVWEQIIWKNTSFFPDGCMPDVPLCLAVIQIWMPSDYKCLFLFSGLKWNLSCIVC